MIPASPKRLRHENENGPRFQTASRSESNLFVYQFAGLPIASATARRARTPTRCARYSALPWMSAFMPSAGMVRPSSDFGEKRFFNASSNDGTRNTPFEPAPVTATRFSLPRFATNTPTSAKRDAWLRNFWYAAFFGIGKITLVMISDGSSAVENIPVK